MNGLLILAVTVLFFLHFRDCGKSATVNAINSTVASSTGFSIAYVDLDTLQAQYGYYKDKKAEFEKNEKALEASYTSGMQSLQKEVYDLQQRATTMTQSEGEAAEKRLSERKNQLDQLRDNGVQNLQAEMGKFNIEMYGKIDSVLEQYKKDHKFAYVLSYQKGGAILYTDKSLDITKDVVEMLNKMSPAKK